MKTIQLIRTLSALVLVGSVGIVEAQSLITSVSIPAGSQDGVCRPVLDNLYSAVTPPYPLNTTLGIGNILNPTIAGVGGSNYDTSDFSMHDHVYVGSGPDPSRAVVTFTFNVPTVVDQLQVVQHSNGITRIEGFVGNSPDSLTSIGNVYGTHGDVGGWLYFAERFRDTFDFNNTAAGTHYKFVVTKGSSGQGGWATYRMFPADAAGVPFAVATGNVVPVATKIIAVSIPVGSQSPGRSRPSRENVWSATAPIDVTIGIGVLLDPILLPAELAIPDNFVMIQQGPDAGLSPYYIAPNVPYPAGVTVSYTFNQPTIVSGVRIYQHVNGITRVSGELGNSAGAMVTLGNVFGPAGDITGSGNSGFVVAHEGDAQDFLFGNSTVAGSNFNLTVTKTVFYNAFATWRIIPLDGNGQPIYADTTTPPPTPCAQLQAQLNTANATVQSLTTQLNAADDLAAALNAQLTVISQQNLTLTQFFQTTFNDPTFQIPGETPQQQIQNLVQAIQALNNGQRKALYKNLGGTQ